MFKLLVGLYKVEIFRPPAVSCFPTTMLTSRTLKLYSLAPRLTSSLTIGRNLRPLSPLNKSPKMHFSNLPQSVAAKTTESGDSYNAQLASSYQTLALRSSEDDPQIRQKYRPFILCDDVAEDWVNNLELTTVLNMAENNISITGNRLKVLVLYGSLRRRSYSKLVAFEASRILFRLGCDVRVFDPEDLPVKNDKDQNHPKVQELRELSAWSDGHIWVSPEQHGNLVSTSSLHNMQ